MECRLLLILFKKHYTILAAWQNSWLTKNEIKFKIISLTDEMYTALSPKKHNTL